MTSVEHAAILPGPIALTGADGQVGRALRRRLAALPNEVRPVGRSDDLARALHDADAVVHLAGTLRPVPPDTYEDANLGTVERTLAALDGSAVERVVFLSYLGARRTSANAYLRAKADAEELLHHCGRDAVVFRCGHVYGPLGEPGPLVASLLAREGRPVWVLGDGEQRLAPVYLEDVVDAIVVALDPQRHHGRFDLPGPEVLSLNELVRIVNGGIVRLRHVPALVARTLAHAAPSLTPELVDVLLADSLGDQVRVDRAFDLERRRVRDVYRPVAAAA
jgi:NADH dehydrogenase